MTRCQVQVDLASARPASPKLEILPTMKRWRNTVRPGKRMSRHSEPRQGIPKKQIYQCSLVKLAEKTQLWLSEGGQHFPLIWCGGRQQVVFGQPVSTLPTRLPRELRIMHP